MANYMKTCSFLHDDFTESIKMVENLFSKKLMVKNSFIERTYVEVHIEIASMRQFRCKSTIYVI